MTDSTETYEHFMSWYLTTTVELIEPQWILELRSALSSTSQKLKI